MKILLANKFYYEKGGSERCLFTLETMLKQAGHETSAFAMKHPDNLPSENADLFVDNIDYNNLGQYSAVQKLKLAFKLVYSLEAKKKMAKALDRFGPDIVHCHNIYHQLSPSIFVPAKKRNIPITLTLHDYKLACMNMEFYCRGQVCERCSGHLGLAAIKNKCVKNSTVQSALAVVENIFTGCIKMYDKVDVFISPSQFLKDKLVEKGWAADKIEVVPNSLDPSEITPEYTASDYILYFGQVVEKKGVMTLIKAMQNKPGGRLKIAGTGALLEEAKKYKAENKLDNIEFMGFLSGNELKQAIAGTIAVVVPSEWYENCSMSVLEAFAYGKPVIGAKIGGIPEQIKHGFNGYLFGPGNAKELASLIAKCFEDKENAVNMGKNAQQIFKEKYSPEVYLKKHLALYNRLVEKKKEK